MGKIALIGKTFKATITERDGFTSIRWPESVEYFGSTRSVKVRGSMNGVPFQTAFLAVSKKLHKAMPAKTDDTSEVYLEERF